ncbi:uncharacterized protein SAPINGB_P000313 [Magnusiomyces paraingens]|uniref:J domain-containing protein n=1 Tax=Magnusiomyces paraingens TaxID=2606893 RepID=A0A5E8AZD1_9ASCO|nr:uncharacterized protein SAPINGB_P000313 [Saprochaete ingens]VVT44128.1 unnamed protein product [Saprochaete ingens]
MARTHYERLGVEPNATAEDIELAYRMQATTLHPDNSGTGDAKEYRKVTESYQLLSNPEKRREYDKGKTRTRSFGFFSSSNRTFTISSDNGRSPRGSPSLDDDIASETVYSTNSRRTSGPDPTAFYTHGPSSPTSPTSPTSPLTMPPGTGQPVGDKFEVSLLCTLEELSTGSTKKRTLRRQKQDGQMEEKEILVVIEPGYKSGTRITFPGSGDYLAHLRKYQDVVFVIAERRHERFVRDGNDLITELEISFRESMVGFNKTVTLLSGKEFYVAYNKPVDTGYEIIHDGHGMPNRKKQLERGMLRVRIKVVLPKTLSKSQKEVFYNHFPEE